jgi:ATP-dependent DNA ligase
MQSQVSMQDKGIGKTGAHDQAGRDRERCYSRSSSTAKRSICPLRPKSNPPRGEQWLHEVKFDGWRIQLHKHGSSAAAFTKPNLPTHVS